MKKRFLAAMLVFVIVFSSFSGFSLVEAENTLTEEKMTEVLIAVKGKIDISAEYTELGYSYSE